MASSLLALLSQKTPNLQTRKGLILLGLQNDFLAPDGKLPVGTESGFVDRIRELVPAFREFGDVIWVRTEYDDDEPVTGRDPGDCEVITATAKPNKRMPSDAKENNVDASKLQDASARATTTSSSPGSKKRKHPGGTTCEPASPPEDELSCDEELFLTRTSKREPCCIRGSRGGEYADQIKDLVDSRDLQVVKTHYSAFSSTSLLLTLRSKLITELYVCGCSTNLSVYASATDAARYGISITLLADCLGYRKRERHDLAMSQLVDVMAARVTSSTQALESLRQPGMEQNGYDYDDSASSDVVEDDEEWEMGEELTADSEDDEDEMTPPSAIMNVRSPRLYKRSLPDRTVPQKRSLSLQSAGPEATTQHSTQHAEPPCAEPAEFSDHDGGTRDSSRADDVQHCAYGTTAKHGVGGSHQRTAKEPTSPHETSTPAARCTSEERHCGLEGLGTTTGLRDSTSEFCACMSHGRTSHQPPSDLEPEEVMKEAQQHPRMAQHDEMQRKPLFGEDKQRDSGGSEILHDLLPGQAATTIFDELKTEVRWQKMHHQTGEVPRLVCCQGTIAEDGSMPVYRHPSDEALPLLPWSPAVDRVRQAAEQVLGHPLNHALIQLYRGGTDYISEHSDKTLDIARGSRIVNVSFGAQRTMRLRTKRGAAAVGATSVNTASASSSSTPPSRTTYRVPMPHNSMLMLSLDTNAQYLHGINADKRPAVELSEAEKAHDGQRISLTFRHIATFLSADSGLIWGQGAVGKSKGEAGRTVNGDAAASEKMVRAFGTENQATRFDWDGVYGVGFDVLHLK